MIRESITIDEALGVLNRMVGEDADAVSHLCLTRVECNQALAENPTVQVGHVDDDPAKPLEVGFLGVLNGLFGADDRGWGAICGVWHTVCPKGCGPLPERAKRHDPCPHCATALVVGGLQGFWRTSQIVHLVVTTEAP